MIARNSIVRIRDLGQRNIKSLAELLGSCFGIDWNVQQEIRDEQGSMKERSITASVLIAVGLLMFVVAAYQANKTLQYLRLASETEGVVTGVEQSEPRDGEAGVYYPVIEYFVATGEKHSFKSSVGTTTPDVPGAFHLGDKATVLYLPQAPQDARLKSFVYLWFLPLAFSFAAIVLNAIGLCFLCLPGKLGKN